MDNRSDRELEVIDTKNIEIKKKVSVIARVTIILSMILFGIPGLLRILSVNIPEIFTWMAIVIVLPFLIWEFTLIKKMNQLSD